MMVGSDLVVQPEGSTAVIAHVTGMVESPALCQCHLDPALQ